MYNKWVFTELNCAMRTNNEFINWIDKNYQLKSTILTEIPGLEFVDSIILDVMHLVFLGIMRTMLSTWNNGVIPFKLSRQMIQ